MSSTPCKPNELVAFAWGSRSTSKIRLPNSANAAPRFTAVVVLPTPPFWLAIATIFILGSARGSRAGDGGLAIAEFLFRIDLIWCSKDSGRAAEIGTRAACAPQNEQS